ncbi:MAG: cytidine deaminase [Lachnospiraceae bacterium]|nr:cytidine deaminase [Lachnospiraceae bacterium]
MDYTYEELIEKAYKASEFAYSPYSKFNVGAAVAVSDFAGEVKMFTGCNVENSSYGGTICAERTAMCKAVSEGYSKLMAIAVVSSEGSYTYPCGICRQFLSEFSDKETVVILHDKDKNNVKKMLLCELIPEAFTL